MCYAGGSNATGSHTVTNGGRDNLLNDTWPPIVRPVEAVV